MRPYRISLVGVLLAALMSGCTELPPGPRGSPEAEGFKPFPSVRSFDRPGRIYREDPSGNVFAVILLEVQPEFRRRLESS